LSLRLTVRAAVDLIPVPSLTPKKVKLTIEQTHMTGYTFKAIFIIAMILRLISSGIFGNRADNRDENKDW